MWQTKCIAGTLITDVVIKKIIKNFNGHLKNAMSASKYKKKLLINFNKIKKEKIELKKIKYINLDLIHFEHEHTRTQSQI